MKSIHLGLLIFAAQALALNAHAQTQTAPLEVYEPAEGALFNEEVYMTGTDPVLSQFDNVIVVNKAAKGTTAQTLKMYSKGVMVLETKVSTGKEVEEVVKGAKKFFRKLFNTKGAKESHWKHTPRGYYPVERVENANYRSGESKFQMPYAMFFNLERGIAIHQVPPDLSGGEAAGEAQLGKRASSACVRVHKSVVQDIHSRVTEAGKVMMPQVDRKTGLQVINKDGSLATKLAFRTLVIVQELND